MFEKYVRENIDTYLMYSNNKTLSIEEYIKIREQSLKEYSLKYDQTSSIPITEEHVINKQNNTIKNKTDNNTSKTEKPNNKDIQKSLSDAELLEMLKGVED